MLAAPTLTTEYLDLSYSADAGMLVVRWLRAVSFAEIQEGFRAAREMSYSHETARWLVDVRHRNDLDAAASGWVATTLLPAVAAESAPARLRVAYLLLPSRVELLHSDCGLRAAMAMAEEHPTYTLQVFVNEGEAFSWLTS